MGHVRETITLKRCLSVNIVQNPKPLKDLVQSRITHLGWIVA